MKLSFTLNGRAVRLDVAPGRRAIDVLREDLRGGNVGSGDLPGEADAAGSTAIGHAATQTLGAGPCSAQKAGSGAPAATASIAAAQRADASTTPATGTPASAHAAPCAPTPETSAPGQAGLDEPGQDAPGMDGSGLDGSDMDERALDVKEGCGTGECGACSILVDGVQKLSCLMLAAQLHGRKIVTAAGLGTPEAPHPIQRAFAEHGAVQCGFCTPGMVVAAASLLAANPAPGREDIRRALSGNLCRCTGYVKIVDAVDAAAKEIRHELREELCEELSEEMRKTPADHGRGAPAGPEPQGGGAPAEGDANAKMRTTARRGAKAASARPSDNTAAAGAKAAGGTTNKAERAAQAGVQSVVQADAQADAQAGAKQAGPKTAKAEAAK